MFWGENVAFLQIRNINQNYCNVGKKTLRYAHARGGWGWNFWKSHIFTGFMDANHWSLRLIVEFMTITEFKEKSWNLNFRGKNKRKRKGNFACQQILIDLNWKIKSKVSYQGESVGNNDIK